MPFATLNDLNFRNRRVIVRVDFNVPVDDDGNITDDKRLAASLPTVQHLLESQAQQIILMAHLGRPKGQVVEKLRMDKVAERFSELIGREVMKADSCVDIDLPYGKIVLLENLRFNPEETSDKDWERQEFAKKLADYADYYVNDAFGTSHRKHASCYDIAKYIPGCVGKLVEKELKIIGDAMENPNHPFVAVMGGAKLETKIGVIKELLKKVDKILLGGAMIFTFYKVMGKEVGKSLVQNDMMPVAREILDNHKDKIVLPVDVVAAVEADDESETDVFRTDNIPMDMMGLDIGPETINQFKEIIKQARTVVWNGPMGFFEHDRFKIGTNEIAKAMAECPGTTIIGGGDTDAAIDNLGIGQSITHISTGGGASLKLLEGRKLVAIEALEKNYEKFSLKSA